jgi:DNA-binding transcriptional ArsR family regulator
MSGSSDEARFAFEGLDRLFHERARLGIVTSLAGNPDGLAFGELKRLCGLTDGNLSRHLSALDEAGYVSMSKDRGGRRPVTMCRLTTTGRERFVSYLAALETALKEGTRAAAETEQPHAKAQRA